MEISKRGNERLSQMGEWGAKWCLSLNIDPWVLIMKPIECEGEYICVMVLGVIQTRGEQTQPTQPRS